MALLQDNFNNLLPAAPAGGTNVLWQAQSPTTSPRFISAYVPNLGSVDARTTTIEVISTASQGKLVTFNNGSATGVALDPSGAIVAAAVSTIGAGGTGYAVNDTFNISGGTGGTGHVTAESGGVVSAIAIDNPGFGYSVSAGNATTATSGIGTGLQIDISIVGGSIASGFVCFVENLGAGLLTITPGTGNINGSATLALTQTQAAILFFDGTNWWAIVISSISFPITVGQGGTGDTTLAAHGVLIGEGTAAVAVTGAGTAGQVLTSNGASSDPTFQALPTNPYDIIFTFAAKPGNLGGSVTYPWIVFTRAVTFPGNFSGSYGQVLTNPAGTVSITVNKNGSSVGTISIATSGTFTFTTSGGTSFSVAAGDYLTLVYPTQDASMKDLMITLAGTR